LWDRGEDWENEKVGIAGGKRQNGNEWLEEGVLSIF